MPVFVWVIVVWLALASLTLFLFSLVKSREKTENSVHLRVQVNTRFRMEYDQNIAANELFWQIFEYPDRVLMRFDIRESVVFEVIAFNFSNQQIHRLAELSRIYDAPVSVGVGKTRQEAFANLRLLPEPTDTVQ